MVEISSFPEAAFRKHTQPVEVSSLPETHSAIRSPLSSEGGGPATEGPHVFPKDHIRVGCLYKKSIGTSGVCWDQVRIPVRL